MWHFYVTSVLSALITLVTIVTGVIAFVHCLTQRSEAFPAIGTIQKPAWLAIIGVSVVLSLFGRGIGPVNLFSLIALAASALYLLDVRPGLREATGGQGPW